MKRLQYILYFIVISIFAFSLTRGNTDKNNKTEGDNLKDIKPCELLTSEQVTTVLPGHDEGYVAKDGGSLIEGVDSYQCSYCNDSCSDKQETVQRDKTKSINNTDDT
jgi:hypothetical protein